MTTGTYNSDIPQNSSILQLTKFTFFIPDKPYLRYFCQTVNLPSISTTEIPVSTPFSTTYRHGEKLNFEPLTISALIDEDMRMWQETYNWLKSLTRPESFAEYPRKDLQDRTPLYFDGILTLNTNANKPNLRFKFLNCHPISMSMLNLDTKTDADNIPTCDITFRYDLFEVERLN